MDRDAGPPSVAPLGGVSPGPTQRNNGTDVSQPGATLVQILAASQSNSHPIALIIPGFISFSTLLGILVAMLTSVIGLVMMDYNPDEPPLLLGVVDSIGLNMMVGMLNLVLIYCTWAIVSNRSRVSKLAFWIAIILGPTLFGLSVWTYHMFLYGLLRTTLPVDYYSFPIPAWQLTRVPQSFRGCEACVDPPQASLFTENIYKTQFPRILSVNANKGISLLEYDESLFLSVQADEKLCYQGFQGNGDLYGLGVRIGIYLQWVASLLSNNLLPESRKEHEKAYLISSIAICAATIVLSFTGSCVFSIEIEILYWMYWGGFLCVIVSSPSQIRLRRHAQWINLHWSIAIQYTTHTLMTYHGIWFIWYAYDQVFSRMPCGTYQFFLAPILDPSRTFCFIRDVSMQLSGPLALSLVLGIPLIAIALSSEIKKSILDSAMYQRLFSRSDNPGSGNIETTAPDPSTRQFPLRSRILLRWISANRKIKRLYRLLRRAIRLLSHSRSGIQQITPLEIGSHRNYRTCYAILGLASYAMSITAIEATLKWNKVVNVNSISTTGQYMPLIIGLAIFLSVCWQILQQWVEKRPSVQRSITM